MKSKFYLLPLALLLMSSFYLLKTNFKNEENEKEEGNNRIASSKYWNSLKGNVNSRVFEPADMYATMMQAAAFKNQQGNKSLGLQWKSLGPSNVGGRTRAVLIDKANPSKIYAGGVSGGLWVSTDAGSNWTKHPQSDAFKSMCITALAQSKNGDIYFGTGELIGANEVFQSNGGVIGALGFPGYGIYKSTDGGTTFTHLTSTTPTGTGTSSAWQYIDAIACDNLDNDLVYVATHKGLYKTTDGGSSFAHPTGAAAVNWCTDVQVASNGNVITFIGNPNSSPNSKAYISTDHGANFSLSGNLKNGGTFQRVKFAFAPSNPNVIYAGGIKLGTGANSGSNTNGGVFRTDDGGTTWIQVGNGASGAFDLYNQGVYTMSLAVKPDNENILYTGGLDLWKYDHNNLSWTKVSNQGTFTTNHIYVHADHHAALFAPNNPNVLYIGTDGGIFVTTNANSSSPSFAQKNKQYTTFQGYGLGVGADGSFVTGGQDNGTWYNNYENNYYNYANEIKGGDGFQCAISQLNKRCIFGTTYGDQAGIEDHVARSLNGGLSMAGIWDEHIDADANGTPDDGGQFVTKIYLWENLKKNLSIADSLTRSRLYYSSQNSVWMTPQALNTAPRWYRISAGGIINNAFCFEGTLDGDIVYVGTESGGLFRISGLNRNYPLSYTGNFLSTASGAGITTTKLYQEPNSRTITGIAVDKTNNDNIVFTTAMYGATSYVMRINNAATATGLTTPTDITGNLPKWPCYDVAVNPGDGLKGVLATEGGVYSTPNIWASSVTWSDENASFPNVPTLDLQFVADTFGLYKTPTHALTDYFLFASTFGRGVFYTNSLCTFFDSLNTNRSSATGIASVNNPIEFSIYPNPAQDVINISINAISNQNSVVIYDLKGTKVYSSNDLIFGQQAINIAHLNKGAYIIKITSGKNTSTKKFVKM